MAATKAEIAAWFQQGMHMGQAFMLVVCDGFTNEDYPVYAATEKELRHKADDLNGRNMQHVLESYDLKLDMQIQLAEVRAWHGWRPA